MKSLKILISLALIVFLNLGFANSGINWQSWSADAFAQAKTENKMILLNVGYEGCTACRYMEENTFNQTVVIDLINKNFIAIQVDSEARPDIGERYSDWAWPANAFMHPDGTQLLAFAGSRRADVYLGIIEELVKGFSQGSLTVDRLAPYGVAQAPQETSLTAIRDAVRKVQDKSIEGKIGGVFENSEPLRQLLLRYYIYGDQKAFYRAKPILDGLTQQMDWTWGGMFYAAFGRWDNVIPEKRTESQASALQLFADAYQLTGDKKYLKNIDNIHQYLSNFMQSKDGTFYSSQQDRVVNLPKNMNIKDFYKLNDKDRRALGIPVKDHTVYTDINARVISGYVMAFAATGNKTYLNMATTAAEHLIQQRLTKDGWVLQFKPDEEFSKVNRIHVITQKPIQYLKTQAHLGQALLDLYYATAEDHWLTSANGIADALLANLEDGKNGGFYGATDDGTPGRRKPLEDNAAAARFLYLLGKTEKNTQHTKAAQRAILASSSNTALKREGRITGKLALALETLTAGYVEFSVVGDKDDALTQELLKAARKVYEPRKLVHIEAAGRYPKLSKPAMYICNENACSLPIQDPSKVGEQAKRYTFSKDSVVKVTSI